MMEQDIRFLYDCCFTLRRFYFLLPSVIGAAAQKQEQELSIFDQICTVQCDPRDLTANGLTRAGDGCLKFD